MPEITSRSPIRVTENTIFNKVEIGLNVAHLEANRIDLFQDGEYVGRIQRLQPYDAWPNDIYEIRKRVIEGSAILVWDFTENSLTGGRRVSDANVPLAFRHYVDERNPFNLIDPPPLTQLEQRRKDVEDWARTNTTPAILAKSIVEGYPANNADPLANKRRTLGQIWWNFVLMTTAAAQHDDWLSDDDTNVWPAIQRNTEVTAHQFFEDAAVEAWNEHAGYIDALSRVYQAARNLTSAPIHIRMVPPLPAVLPILHGGAPAAKAIIYGG